MMWIHNKCLCAIVVMCCVPQAFGFQSVIKLKDAPLQTELAEDLEPVLTDLTNRYRKQAVRFGQNFVYDERLEPECLQSYARIMQGIMDVQPWALKFFDATGIITPNILEGRLIAHGSYDECLDIRVPNKEDPNRVDFNGKYCTLGIHLERQPFVRRHAEKFVQADKYLKHYVGNITWLLNFIDRLPIAHRMGICLPSTCDPEIVPYFIEKFAGKYGLSGTIMGCRDPLNEKPFRPGTLAALTVTCVLIVIVVLATLVDIFVPLNNKEAVKFVQCFSARAATNRLTGTNTLEQNRHLDCVHGIRVLSAMWILVAHTYGTDPGNLDRSYHLFEKLNDAKFTVVMQSIYSVDTFFALTGILLYRSILTERKRFKAIGNIPFAITVLIRRAIRLLTPTLGALCLLYIIPVFVTGPSMDYLFDHFSTQCSERWWHIPLFISNFYTFDQSCLMHSWYMSADIQMLIILIMPLLYMLSRPRRGMWLIAAIGVASIIYAGTILTIYDTTPTVLIIPMQLTRSLLYSAYQHVSSLAHLSVMCIGILGGYLIEHHRDIKGRRSLFMFGWLLCVVLTSAVVFAGKHPPAKARPGCFYNKFFSSMRYPPDGSRVRSHHNYEISALFLLLTVGSFFVARAFHEAFDVPVKWARSGVFGYAESLAYVMLSRPAWAVSIVWIVYACGTGYGEPVRSLFNRPNVIVLSRLSFSFYLVSSTLVLAKMFAARTATPFTHYHELRDFCADLVWSYILGYVLFLLFEGPTHALDKWIVSLCSRRPCEERNGCTSNNRECSQKLKACTAEAAAHEVKNAVLQCVKSRL